MKRLALCALLVLSFGIARADAVDALRRFVDEIKTGQAMFTQTVTSPDGARKKVSSGSFEFARPNRFRFAYTKPFDQLIVADGEKVWIHDKDLDQVSSRKIASALGSAPAALLAGGSLERDFTLSALPAKDGLEWVQALPKAKDGPFQSMRVGFRGRVLAAVEIVDGFNQRSLLQFGQFVPNAALAADRFVFMPPAGVPVLEQ